MKASAGGGDRPARASNPGRLIIRLVVFVAAVLLAVGFAREERRATHDPRFCTSSCHHEPGPRAMGAAADWHTNGHADATCQDCHAVSFGTGLRLLVGAYGKTKAVVPHGKMNAAACSSCHEKSPADWRLIAATAGHREHINVKKVDCLSCHAASTHAAEAPEKACLGCHEDQRLHKPTTVGAETCLSCHSYTASAKNVRPPSTETCEKCHASSTAVTASAGGVPARPLKDVNDHALHGGVACQLCHNAHGIKPKPPEGQPICAKCHQFENFQVGNEQRAGPAGHRGCEGCHKPHAPRETAIDNCVTCHEWNAKGRQAGGGEVKTTALQHKNCASCHVPHTWKAERSGCMQCHKEQTQLFLTRSPPQHRECVDCHDVHGAPPTGAVCLKCHSNTKGKHVALAPEKHKDCTSCHNPHSPKPEDTRTVCAKCHSNELTQVMRDGPEGHAKDSCFSCHKPHENPLPPVDICAKCHGERWKTMQATAPAKHKLCTSCHEKHKFRITDAKAICSQCHGPVFDAAAKGVASIPHDGECKKCHTLHGSPGVPRDACLQCHQKVATEWNPPNEKHGACKSCHQPHMPASQAPAKCRGCHEDKAAIAAKWPAASAHAQECNKCHQQHDVRKKKACVECHAAEATSATGSKHECKQCHPPHGAPPGVGPAWWSRCDSCHAAKVATAKERGPTHSECKNCHKPHRFALPTCTSCHKDMGNKGLHAVEKHAASCTACHDPHVKSLPSREQCLACHTTRRGHEPNAKQCYTCHMFQ